MCSFKMDSRERFLPGKESNIFSAIAFTGVSLSESPRNLGKEMN